MIQLSAPYSIGDHVYFLREGTITEGVASECTVKFDGQDVSIIYAVAYFSRPDGPTVATFRKDKLFATRTDLVNSLMHHADTLTPDEAINLHKHYNIQATVKAETDAEPDTDTAPLTGKAAEIAQQWYDQLNNEPMPIS